MIATNSTGGPFQRMVILGDSISYGMCAHEPDNEWHQVVANLLRKFQDVALTVFNRGIPANVISPRCPGYPDSVKPSLLERYHKHCIKLKPDLVIIAEGLNDMRSGMPLRDYRADLEEIVCKIQDQTGALVVLLGIYHQIHGYGMNDPVANPTRARWNHDLAEAYNLAIRLVAKKHHALFVDAWNILGGADWVLHPDGCHLNDLGHVLIGNAIFQTIATACDGVAAKTKRVTKEQWVSMANTGGTDSNAEIWQIWQAAAANHGVTFKE